MSYDARGRAFRFYLRSGVVLTIPAHAIAELAQATTAQLKSVALVADGGAIEQRELDVDLSVPNLLRDVLGFGELQQRKAARTRSPAKAAAARVNGAKGGRPRKVAKP